MTYNAHTSTLSELRKNAVAAALLLAVIYFGGMLAATAIGWWP
jgi:hypothetical protein